MEMILWAINAFLALFSFVGIFYNILQRKKTRQVTVIKIDGEKVVYFYTLEEREIEVHEKGELSSHGYFVEKTSTKGTYKQVPPTPRK